MRREQRAGVGWELLSDALALPNALLVASHEGEDVA